MDNPSCTGLTSRLPWKDGRTPSSAAGSERRGRRAHCVPGQDRVLSRRRVDPRRWGTESAADSNSKPLTSATSSVEPLPAPWQGSPSLTYARAYDRTAPVRPSLRPTLASDVRCLLDQGGAWRRRWPDVSGGLWPWEAPPGRTPGHTSQNAQIKTANDYRHVKHVRAVFLSRPTRIHRVNCRRRRSPVTGSGKAMR